jgi:hypothetical protein
MPGLEMVPEKDLVTALLEKNLNMLWRKSRKQSLNNMSTVIEIKILNRKQKEVLERQSTTMK